MKKKNWKDGKSVAVLIGLAGALLVLMLFEGACYILAHSRWANTYPRNEASPRIWASSFSGSGPNAIPVSYESLPQVKPEFSFESAETPPALDRSGTRPGPLFRLNGYFMNPNIIKRHVLKVADTGEVLYDVVNSTDVYGRRLTPNPDLSRRNKHLLLFGCSVGYGVGLNDNETLGARLAQEAPKFHVYNNSIPGGAPSTYISLSHEDTLWEGVQEDQGVGIYFFVNFHLPRVFGNMSHLATWGDYLPYVSENSKGQFEYLGSFKDARPLLTLFYKILWNLPSVQFFGMDWPFYFSDTHFEKFARIIQQMKSNYEARFPGSTFYVAGYPGSPSNLMANLQPHFERLGIKYLDYSGFQPHLYTGKRAQIKYDGHPTKETVELWSKLLARDLGLNRKDPGH